MLTPERVVDALGQDLAAERYGPLSVYWLKVRKSREQFANQVRECRNGARIVPIVVRSGFDHPDSLFNDLLILLDQNRDEVLSLFSSDASASSVAPPKNRGSIAVLSAPSNRHNPPMCASSPVRPRPSEPASARVCAAAQRRHPGRLCSRDQVQRCRAA